MKTGKATFFISYFSVIPELPALPEPGKQPFIENFFGFFLNSEKTLDRKINEIIIALKLENKLTKEDILLAYANNIMFDGVTLGVNSASLKLFSKSINQVNLAEAALLAGLVNAPTYYNPIKNPLRAKERMDTKLFNTLVH